MIYRKLLIIVFVLSLGGSAFGATYSDVDAGSLTGGGTGALDNVAYTQLANGDTAKVTTTTYTYFYRYDATNDNAANPESSPGVIVPDDNSTGTGAWILKEAYKTNASATAAGIVELATGAETVTGTDATRAVTPDGLTDKIKDEDDMASDSADHLATQKSIKAYVDANSGGGVLGQVVSATFSDVTTCSVVMPYDDTVPTNSEGYEVETLAITPTDASSTLLIEYSAAAGAAAGTNVGGVALYKDSDAAAIGAYPILFTSGAVYDLNVRFSVPASDTNARTYRIRVGPGSGGTVTINGEGGSRKMGGVSKAIMTITEVLP